MKTKILALFILSFTIIGLFFYFGDKFGVSKPKNSKVTSDGQNVKSQTFLEKKESPTLEKVSKTITNKEKVKNLREKSKHFKIIETGNEKFYFDISGRSLTLTVSRNNFEIGNFPLVLERDISIEKIYDNSQKFLLSLGDKKYIFSLKTGIVTNFDFKIPINYIKEDDLYYIISSEKGIFLLDKKTKKINYSHIFSDFVLHNKSYLAIIKSDDKKRLDNFNIKSKKDIIFFYNPISKKQKIVLESDISLEKIYKIGEKVFVENKNGEVFELKNL